MRLLQLFRNCLPALAVLLASCGGGNDEPTAYHVRLINALHDAPAVQLNVDGLPLHLSVDYQKASDYRVPLAVGSVDETADIEVLTFLPDNSTVALAGIEGYAFQPDWEYTVNVAGTMADSRLFVTGHPRRHKPVTGAYVEFINLSINQGNLGVYFTEPDADLAAVTPYAVLDLGESSGSHEISPGPFQIRVADLATGTVLFDSGALGFSGNDEWQISITDNLRPMPSPITLISTKETLTAVLQDRATLAEARAVLIATDHPAVDVYADDAALAPGLAYGTASAYTVIDAGTVDFKVTPVGDASTVLLQTSSGVELGGSYSYFIGSDGDSLVSTSNKDDRRSVATVAKIRFVHAVNMPGYYNAYLTDEVPSTIPPEAETGLGWSLQYGAVSMLRTKAPGEYYLVVTTRPTTALENESLLMDPVPIQLSGGDVTTVMIRQVSDTDPSPTIELIDDRFQ